MQFVRFEIQSGSNDDASDPPCVEVDRAHSVARPPVVVGCVDARRDLGRSSMDDRPIRRDDDEEACGPQPRSKALGQFLSRVQPTLDQVARAADKRGG